MNKWATNRIKELLTSIGSLDFSNGKAKVSEVSTCTGDVNGSVSGETKKVKGYLDIPEFSFGKLDDLEASTSEGCWL
ncbi:hypothetical protein RND81_09G030400 [Saponaria officinalis]|uniref:Activator of Hsp90 ATPase AHSA1-like N-terminal domain-containing protein n=1 Tax=Saponaria officinalis TaxID=3572 RepID=A0AAW1IGV5_SAPOF